MRAATMKKKPRNAHVNSNENAGWHDSPLVHLVPLTTDNLFRKRPCSLQAVLVSDFLKEQWGTTFPPRQDGGTPPSSPHSNRRVTVAQDGFLVSGMCPGSLCHNIIVLTG